MQARSRWFLGMVDQMVADWRVWRDEVRTENLINGLPQQIRKDIGWPDAYASRLSRRAEKSFRR